MSSNQNSWLKHLDFLILDAILVEIAYLIAFSWRLDMRLLREIEIYQSTAVLVVLFAVILDVVFPFHRDVLKRGFLTECRYSIEFAAVILIALNLYHYMLKLGTSFSRTIFIVFGILSTLLLVVGRSVYKTIIRRHVGSSKRLPKMLIITDADMTEKNIAQMQRHAENAYEIVGYAVSGDYAEGRKAESASTIKSGIKSFGSNGSGKSADINTNAYMNTEVNGISCIGTSTDLFAFLQENVVDEVMIDVRDNNVENRLIRELLTMGLVIHVTVAMGTDELPNQHIEMIGNRMVVTAATKPFSHGQMVLKRAMDILGGLVGLIFAGIFFIIFAPIIYIQSPGKIFYSQIRIGLNGRRFRMYKFRSMYPDADARKKELMEQNKMDGFMFKMDNDPRIIPIGKFIRKFSIDEFPQFWNVFKGDMSLVGTRPPTEDEWEQYSPEHRARLSMKPGITGLWQVSGRSDITDFDEVVSLDVKYIREWSLKKDIEILFRTVKVVVTGEGSE